MHIVTRTIFVLMFVLLGFDLRSQVAPENFRPKPEREAMFFPYLAVRHGGPEKTLQWKNENILRYYQELWYYCESFYIKRDHLPEGGILEESIIDISRFEHERQETQEAVVILPGLKDALILLPANRLKHKPEYTRQ